LNQGVLIVDPGGIVVDASDRGVALCHAPPIGRPLAEVGYLGTPDVETMPLVDGSSAVIVTPEPPERIALNGILEQMPASVARLGTDLRVEQVSDLFNRADEAMYRAKRGGTGMAVDGSESPSGEVQGPW
jgi:hypothetical protein